MTKLLDLLNKVRPGINYKEEKHLASSGMIDSLDMMKIIVEIQEVYHVEISMEDMILENFESVNSISDMIKRLEGKIK